MAQLWTGGYEDGNFNWWRGATGSYPYLNFVPAYGRPPENGGDGSLLSMETSPTRYGGYSAKFTVKNSENGTEEDNRDCDVGGVCSKRRTELAQHSQMATYWGGILSYMTERWICTSYYVPADWDIENGSGFGPLVMQSHAANMGSGGSPFFEIILTNTWRISHRWSETLTQPIGGVPWYQQSIYNGSSRPGSGESELLADFPNETASRNALANVNRGGWTDWIINVKYDARGATSGGTGWLDIWKRANADPWVHVLRIVPKQMTIGGYSNLSRGIGYWVPPLDEESIALGHSGSYENGGYGIGVGMYGAKEQFWDLPANRVIYNSNLRIHDEDTTFAEMTPEGEVDDGWNLQAQGISSSQIKATWDAQDGATGYELRYRKS